VARIRTLKPDFWKHEGLCEQPEATHMLAAALLNYVDDYGYFNANPALIKGELYPPETFGPEGNGREGKWNKESGASAPDNSFDFSPFKPLPHDGPTQSAEDEFWELVNTQSKSGALSRAMMVKHAKLSRDFHDSVSCIKSALRAKNPRTYLGKAISNISEEQRAPPEPEGF
jgi:hypothetical protein